jgi:hypothetical protein
MLWLTALRHEVSRAAVGALASVVAFDVDPVPTGARRSQMQHLRNGVGSLLRVTSRVAWRPTPLVSLLYLVSERMQRELRYGFGELGRALAPPAPVRRRQLPLLLLAPAAAGVVVLARKGHAQDSEQLPPIAPASAAESAAVGVGD